MTKGEIKTKYPHVEWLMRYNATNIYGYVDGEHRYTATAKKEKGQAVADWTVKEL